MKLRLPYRLAAAAGLCICTLGVAQERGRVPAVNPASTASATPDQHAADAIAKRLSASPMRGYQVEIICVNGVADIQGTALNAAQREAILDAARSTGVQVRDSIIVAGGVGIGGGAPPLPPGAIPMGPGGPAGGAGGPGAMDPTPLNVPGGAGAAVNSPAMPPYAWPTYAPHNNYSRVAYPEQYPYNAFPFIGPFYPFPKVPLGFRAIKLEWEDGHWFYGRNSSNRDWWKVRYW